jgi:hypothetical protein
MALLLATFEGVSGKIVGVFQPFTAADPSGALVQLVPINLNADPRWRLASSCRRAASVCRTLAPSR